MPWSAWLLVLCLAAAASAVPVRADVSVREAGAAGDGKADDTAAFARAFEKSPDVTVPPGRYRVGPLVVPADATLHGAGRASILLPAAPDKPILRLSSGCRVSDLRIQGDGMKAPAIHGVWQGEGKYLEDVRLERLTIEDVQAFAINFDHARRAAIEGCHIERARRAVELDFCWQVRVTNNVVRQCSEHGIQFWGNWEFKNQDSGDLTFSGNLVEDGGAGAIWGAGARRVVMTGNTVVRCKDVGLDLEWCRDSTIAGNTVTGAVHAGIACFFSCENVAITGNSVEITPQAGGNNFGIWLTGTNRKEFPGDLGHHDIALVGNSICCRTGEKPVGISIDGETHNITAAGNVLRGCTLNDASQR